MHALQPSTVRLRPSWGRGIAGLTLLRRSRSEMGNGRARWTWMPPGKAAIVPLDEAAHEWLARVAQASRGRWTDTTERAGPGEALEVRWWRDDWPQATLRIEVDGLRWIEHSGRSPARAARRRHVAAPAQPLKHARGPTAAAGPAAGA